MKINDNLFIRTLWWAKKTAHPTRGVDDAPQHCEGEDDDFDEDQEDEDDND